MAKADAITPIRKQYLDLKARYPNAILFFRLGDFYETFDEDARTIARELEVVLTSRPMGRSERVPLAGVPHHSLDAHLAKLVSRGFRVAICEQIGDPARAKGLVPREVVRVVSPGTVVEPQLLDSRRNNYLAALCPGSLVRGGPPGAAGIAYIDITTSEFAVAQMEESAAAAELDRLGPAELLLPERFDPTPLPGHPSPCEPAWFDPERATDALKEHFGVATLEGFGCDRLPLATGAAGAVLRYLQANQPTALAQVTRLATYTTDDWMYLDPQTRRNLELFQRSRENTAEGSLLSVLDLTQTPMGGRMLRRWLERPLVRPDQVNRRLDGVAAFHGDFLTRDAVRTTLAKLPDLERLINRVRGGQAQPRDLIALARGLAALPALKSCLPGAGADAGMGLGVPLPPCTEVRELIELSLEPDPPATTEEGGVIRTGFSAELDGLRERHRQGQQAILGLERRERERSGIRSLKVGYNRVFGYYIEVSNVHRSQIPQDYLRKQTLVGAERYYTPELKTLETTVLTAQDRMIELESELFRQVCAQAASQGDQVLLAAAGVAEIDCYAALAEAAARHNYVRPTVDTGTTIRIVAGRHPVVERYVPDGAFVANDADLDNTGCQIAVITGPNMSGKSTYLRQVAVIVLMAQIGSFVPATAATIGLVDRIFSRVGAQDDLATGQSTFMVEMVETANILNHATPRSLLILDEIGRGTSTYDGMSIAQSVIEFIHHNPRVAAKTLFATHYHELTALERRLPRVGNLTSAVAETEQGVVFLHRMLPGGADRSYGLHVARLAGLPEPLVRRAAEILADLERSAPEARPKRRREPATQLALLPELDGVAEALRQMDLDTLTPIQALTALYDLKQRVCAP